METGNPAGPVLEPGESLERLTAGVSVIVSGPDRFCTDTVLLASFAAPRTGETCADFGTGCGAIPLLWHARANPARTYAVEIRTQTCAMARRSVLYNGMQEKIEIVNCDIAKLREQKAVPHGLDLIACNPPYQQAGRGILPSRDERLTARHETACTFEKIAAAASFFLRTDGRFCCCMRPARLCGVLRSLSESGMEPKKLRFVQPGPGKAPFLFLVQAVKAGRPGLTVQPPLLMESENGRISAEVRGIYAAEQEEEK